MLKQLTNYYNNTTITEYYIYLWAGYPSVAPHKTAVCYMRVVANKEPFSNRLNFKYDAFKLCIKFTIYCLIS